MSRSETQMSVCLCQCLCLCVDTVHRAVRWRTRAGGSAGPFLTWLVVANPQGNPWQSSSKGLCT